MVNAHTRATEYKLVARSSAHKADSPQITNRLRRYALNAKETKQMD